MVAPNFGCPRSFKAGLDTVDLDQDQVQCPALTISRAVQRSTQAHCSNVFAMKVKVTYDAEIDAAYIYLVPIGPGDSVKQVSVRGDYAGIILDFDREDHLIGIEFLDASKVLPREILASAVRPGAGS
jgi:uncharacterized protein YuzE